MVGVVTSFYVKKREKQIKYERSVLRELSLKTLQDKLKDFFGSTKFTSMYVLRAGIEEGCYDVAIEAYLLGARYSRFGYYGETQEQVRIRCEEETEHFIETMYHFLLYWGNGLEGINTNTLYDCCKDYVEYWWTRGFQTGKRRHKLRLH